MSMYKEAVTHWMLAHGQVRVRAYEKTTTQEVLDIFKDKGINFEESGDPYFQKMETEPAGYGYKPTKEKVITMRIAPQGALAYSGDFEFYVPREEFDLMVLGMVAGYNPPKAWSAEWLTRQA